MAETYQNELALDQQVLQSPLFLCLYRGLTRSVDLVEWSPFVVFVSGLWELVVGRVVLQSISLCHGRVEIKESRVLLYEILREEKWEKGEGHVILKIPRVNGNRT